MAECSRGGVIAHPASGFFEPIKFNLTKPVKAFKALVETCQVKYQRAADCLTRDGDALLAFYDFPPSTGSTYGGRTPLKAPLRPFPTAPSGQRLPAE